MERINLTPEENFLWQCANQWREPSGLDVPSGLDWERVVRVGVQNRMHTLLYRVLQSTGQYEPLPAAARQAIDDAAATYRARAQWFRESLQRFLPLAAADGLEIVVIKGLYTSINLYFGGDIPGGGKVSRAMFRRFLNATVTPRFPDGVTVTEVTGQYRYRNGRIVVEPSRMVTVLAKDAEDAGRKVDDIIVAYKKKFRQESVAREQRQECAAFQ